MGDEGSEGEGGGGGRWRAVKRDTQCLREGECVAMQIKR